MKQQGDKLLLMKSSFKLRHKPFSYIRTILSNQQILMIAPLSHVSNTQVQAHSDISISPQHKKDDPSANSNPPSFVFMCSCIPETDDDRHDKGYLVHDL